MHLFNTDRKYYVRLSEESGFQIENIREHPMAIWKIMNINKTK